MSNVEIAVTAGPRELSFFVSGGTLRGDAPSYVEREADRRLLAALQRREFCYVLTARQMGKSSLMVRIAGRLREAGFQVVLLDLTQIGQNLTAEQWYSGLLTNVGEQLGIEDELDEFWFTHAQLGPLQRWMAAIERVILAADSSEFRVRSSELGSFGIRNPELGTRNSTPRVVVFLDEIDAVRSLPFPTDEFFAAIRECFNRRARDPAFECLTFCLLGVASPSDLIEDPRTTPFNVGIRIELADFTFEEARPLASGLVHRRDAESAEGNAKTKKKVNGGGTDLRARRAEALLRRVLYWTGGHPYMTQRVCQALAEPVLGPKRQHPRRITAVVDALVHELFFAAGARERDDNLAFVRDRLLRGGADPAGVLDLYAQVRGGRRVRADAADPLVEALRLSGIVNVDVAASSPGVPGLKEASGSTTVLLRLRNRIYTRVFDSRWVREGMPDAERRRQRAAYRRGAARSGGLFSVVLAATALAIVAFTQHRQAKTQREHARAIQYAQSMNLAQAAVREGNYSLAGQLLEEQRPGPGEIDLRGFEWRLLWRLCHQERLTLPGSLSEPPEFVGFADGGRTLVTGRHAASVVTIGFWGATTARRIEALDMVADPDTVSAGAAVWPAFALSPDRKTAGIALSVSGGPRGPADRMAWKIGLIDLSSRRARTLRGAESVIGDLAYSPDGGLLAATGYVPGKPSTPGTITLFALPSGRILATLRDRERLVAIAFSPRGAVLAAARRHGAISIWDVARRRLEHAIPASGRAPVALTFTPDGRSILVGDQDGTVTVRGLARGQPIRTLHAQGAEITCLGDSPDGSTLAAGIDSPSGPRGQVRLWDVNSGEALPCPSAHPEEITSLAISPNGRSLATASGDGSVKLWPLFATPDPSVTGPVRADLVALTASAGAGALAAAMRDGTVVIGDSRSGRIRTLPGIPGVLSACLSPDARTLALGTARGLLMRNIAAGGADSLLESKPVTQVESAGANGLVILDGAGRASFLDRFGRSAMQLGDSRNPVSALAVSRDGKVVALGSDRAIQLWDATTRRMLKTLVKDAPGPLAVSADGRMLASGEENVIHLTDLRTGEVSTLRGHLRRVSSLTFSPDGRTLASSSAAERSIRLWQAATRQEVGALEGAAAGNPMIAFSGDGTALAAVGVDRRLRVWRASLEPSTDTR